MTETDCAAFVRLEQAPCHKNLAEATEAWCSEGEERLPKWGIISLIPRRIVGVGEYAMAQIVMGSLLGKPRSSKKVSTGIADSPTNRHLVIPREPAFLREGESSRECYSCGSTMALRASFFPTR